MKDDKGHHDASDEGGVTTDEAALSTVETLMAERRKYETWLETLEARRQSTPEHVFTRVHADYHDRLDAVIQQLKEHTEGLRVELASLSSRISSLDHEQQQRRDERAEAELAAHVGELSPDAWKEIANESDKAIDALTARHGELERERLRTRELLNEAERPPMLRDAVPVIAPPKQPAAAARASEEASAPVPAPAPAHAASAQTAPAQAAAEQPPVELPPPAIAAEAKLTEQAGAAASSDRTDADVTPRPMPRADAGRPATAKPNAFDELAFLSSVVNTPAGVETPLARRACAARAANEGEILNMANEPGTVLQGGAVHSRQLAPLDERVGRQPDHLQGQDGPQTAKTLKCGECGAMNYPDRVVLRALRGRAGVALSRGGHEAKSAGRHECRPALSSCLESATSGRGAALASWLFWRAARFLWIRPLRAARSSRLTAAVARRRSRSAPSPS